MAHAVPHRRQLEGLPLVQPGLGQQLPLPRRQIREGDVDVPPLGLGARQPLRLVVEGACARGGGAGQGRAGQGTADKGE